jgi:hypothetical protein
MDRWSGSEEAEMATRAASLPVAMLIGTCIGMAVGADHAP